MVEFNFLEKCTLGNRVKLKSFLADICRSEKKDLEDLSIVFCSDDYLLQVNRDFLQHDYYTDIITFDYAPTKGIISGELFISVTRVRDNARQFQTTFKEELHRVMFHGLLHLCGYSDKSNSAKKKMRDKEDFYLGLYFEGFT